MTFDCLKFTSTMIPFTHVRQKKKKNHTEREENDLFSLLLKIAIIWTKIDLKKGDTHTPMDTLL